MATVEVLFQVWLQGGNHKSEIRDFTFESDMFRRKKWKIEFDEIFRVDIMEEYIVKAFK